MQEQLEEAPRVASETRKRWELRERAERRLRDEGQAPAIAKAKARIESRGSKRRPEELSGDLKQRVESDRVEEHVDDDIRVGVPAEPGAPSAPGPGATTTGEGADRADDRGDAPGPMDAEFGSITLGSKRSL